MTIRRVALAASIAVTAVIVDRAGGSRLDGAHVPGRSAPPARSAACRCCGPTCRSWRRHRLRTTATGPPTCTRRTALPTTGGGHQTVALVDAYDDPTIEQDLATYRAYYGLPPCTTANGCFRKVNQDGEQGNYPIANPDWEPEEALDVEMVSAICPKCHIILVEANSADEANVASSPLTHSDLGAAVDTAVNLGATEVSNSYGSVGPETDNTFWDHYYNHPGVAITVSSGDRTTASRGPRRRRTSPRSAARRSSRTRARAAGARPCGAASAAACPPTDRAPAAVARSSSRSRRGSTTQAARAAPSPTSRRSRIPSTGVAVYDSSLGDRRLGRGRRHERRVADHRSGVRARGQRREGRRTARTRTATRIISTTSRRGRTSRRARCAAISARAARATTARPATARRTGPAPSSDSAAGHASAQRGGVIGGVVLNEL